MPNLWDFKYDEKAKENTIIDSWMERPASDAEIESALGNIAIKSISLILSDSCSPDLHILRDVCRTMFVENSEQERVIEFCEIVAADFPSAFEDFTDVSVDNLSENLGKILFEVLKEKVAGNSYITLLNASCFQGLNEWKAGTFKGFFPISMKDLYAEAFKAF